MYQSRILLLSARLQNWYRYVRIEAAHLQTEVSLRFKKTKQALMEQVTG